MLTYNLFLLWWTKNSDESKCSLPSVDGEQPECVGYFLRFRYNDKTNDCEEFVYGGCGGNKNNYPDEESCAAACVKH